MAKKSFIYFKQTWFKAFYTPTQGTALHTWYSFYNPAFLDHLKGNSYTSYSRETFLESAYADYKLFHSVESIQLSCTPNDFLRIAQELSYLKCELIGQEGEKFIIDSGDIKIIIEQSNIVNYSQITQITCNLNEEDDSTIRLGNLTIKNQGKVSIWDFNQLHKTTTN